MFQTRQFVQSVTRTCPKAKHLQTVSVMKNNLSARRMKKEGLREFKCCLLSHFSTSGQSLHEVGMTFGLSDLEIFRNTAVLFWCQKGVGGGSFRHCSTIWQALCGVCKQKCIKLHLDFNLYLYFSLPKRSCTWISSLILYIIKCFFHFWS